MARARLTATEFDFVRQLEWEQMSPAQLKSARETWSTGAVYQDDVNPRVWWVRSYSARGDGGESKGRDGKRFHHVTLKADHGYPRFTCTCKHGQHSLWASCWHAKTVARIYRIMVDQMKQQEKEDLLHEYRSKGRD